MGKSFHINTFLLEKRRFRSYVVICVLLVNLCLIISALSANDYHRKLVDIPLTSPITLQVSLWSFNAYSTCDATLWFSSEASRPDAWYNKFCRHLVDGLDNQSLAQAASNACGLNTFQVISGTVFCSIVNNIYIASNVLIAFLILALVACTAGIMSAYLFVEVVPVEKMRLAIIGCQGVVAFATTMGLLLYLLLGDELRIPFSLILGLPGTAPSGPSLGNGFMILSIAVIVCIMSILGVSQILKRGITLETMDYLSERFDDVKFIDSCHVVVVEPSYYGNDDLQSHSVDLDKEDIEALINDTTRSYLY